ncbi:MAG: patatin-like phospholipase family protein [Spirochaetia bacterium]
MKKQRGNNKKLSVKKLGKIGLALSGGAAKGLGHIGALKALEEVGVRPAVIAGTSAGSIIGGMYAAGIGTDELEEIAMSMDRTRFRRLLDLTWARGSMVAGNKVEEFLHGILGDKKIENLSIPFIATAVDIKTGRGFYFTEGSLVDAIRASISIPGVFEPVRANGGLLVDGGVRQNIPLSILKDYKVKTLIGVDVFPKQQLDPSWETARIERNKNEDNKDPFWARIWDRITGEEEETEMKPEAVSLTTLLTQLFMIVTTQISQYEIKYADPDFLISLDMSDIALWEFWRGKEAIEIGYRQAKETLRGYGFPD